MGSGEASGAGGGGCESLAQISQALRGDPLRTLVKIENLDGYVVSETDLARGFLIRDLTEGLGVNAEGVGVALHLVDQMYGLRRALSEVLKSRDEQG